MRQRVWLVSAAVTALCGCIEFDSQTAAYRYDRGQDRLLIFQDYHGIHGGSGEELGDDEEEQLRSVLQTQRTFFFANWIWEYHRTAIEKQLAKLAAHGNQEAAQAEEPPLERALAQQGVVLMRTLLDNVEVRNGKFYRDAQGQLAGYQLVTVNNLSQLVAQANATISAAILAGHIMEAASAETKAALRRAAADQTLWLTVDGNAIRLRIPMAHHDFNALKEQWAANVRKQRDDPTVERDALLRTADSLLNWLGNDLWVSYVDGVMELRVGRRGAPRTSITMVIGRGYRPNAVAFAENDFGPFAKPDIAAEMDRFLGPVPAPKPHE